MRELLTRRLWCFLAVSALASFALVNVPQAPASAAPGPILNVVAHEDDDLLFLSPDLLHAVQGGGKVRTIFVTASDDGRSASYWQSLEKGSQAAYAKMAGVANSWTKTDAGIAGHPMPLYTLSGNPNISLIFMRLPDGNCCGPGLDGSGFASTGYQSLQKLWTGAITSISAVDGSSSYTKSSLTSTLTSLMSAFQPSQIRTQDYAGSYGDGDHSDHHTTAYLTQAAQQNYTTPHTLTGYYDYGDSNLPANVSGADLTAKQNAFYTYGPYDSTVCSSQSSCAGTAYASWLPRQYTVSQVYDPVADAGVAQTMQVNSTVQLHGAASYDPSGNPLTYQWSQTAGTPVTLSSTTAAQPTFTAPASPATLTFQLIVSNGPSTSSPGTVTVTITSGAGSASPTVLVGDTNVESFVDQDPAGTAEAFQYIAGASGTANSASFYLDSSNAATSAKIGVYSDNGAPGTLLASATDSSLRAGAWNTVSLPSFSVTSGAKYWIGLLGSGGAISWRDSQSGLAADVSSSTSLTSLPSSWSTGQVITSGGVSPASFYISSGGGSSGNTVTVTNPGSQTGSVGTAVSLQVSASDSASGQTLTYSASGLPAGLSISSSSGLISGTPTTAGTSSVTVTATDTTGASGSASFTWTISGGGGGGGTCTISEDSSTPAVATSQGNTTGSITTGSFSPPAGSLLVATLNVGMGSVPPGTLSVTDSSGGTWTAGPSTDRD